MTIPKDGDDVHAKTLNRIAERSRISSEELKAQEKCPFTLSDFIAALNPNKILSHPNLFIVYTASTQRKWS
jgi:hypothetical protein